MEVVSIIKPFWGRVTVIESPVDQVQLSSGVILPMELPDGVKRGVISHIDTTWMHDMLDQVKPGTVVFYEGGVTLGDVDVVEMNQILAFES